MYHAAISTDIKKSSKCWAKDSEAMFEAVKHVNAITEYIFKYSKTDSISQLQLPNSPEGDAFTFYYYSEDINKLKTHVKKVAHTLQRAYHQARKITDLLTVGEILKCNEEFTNYIFVRIGVAFSTRRPIAYDYNDGVKSYRGSVIAESERAEAHGAPYKDGIGVTQPNEPVIVEKDNGETFKIDGFDIVDQALHPNNIDTYKVSKEEIHGYILFIHYHFAITLDQVKKEPHLYKYMLQEFEEIHKQTLSSLTDELKTVELVKIKRSTDAMIFISDEIVPCRVWNLCLQICANLPEGSSIGIGFSADGKKKLNQVTYDGDKKDYFGSVVNLAARMESENWSYDDAQYHVEENNHSNRVAMTTPRETTINGWGEWGKEKPPGRSSSLYNRPIQIEDIPLSAINAGTDKVKVRVISAHVTRGDPITVGDRVKYEDKEATVLKMDLLKATIKVDKTDNETTKYLYKLVKIPQEKLPPLSMVPKVVLKEGVASLKF